MSLEILLHDGRISFSPGEELTGVVRWTLDSAPAWIELRLFWYTQGKGTQDVGPGVSQRFTQPSATAEQPFVLRAPSMPPSCSGRLVSVRWALELVSSDDQPVTRVEVVIGPEGREILLGHAE